MYMEEALVFATGGRSNFRIPSLVADESGILYAFCNNRKETVADSARESDLVFSRKKPGRRWEPVRTLATVPGWACSMGSAVYDRAAGTVMCSGRRIPVQREEFREYTREQTEDMDRQAERLAREAGIPAGQFLLYTTDGGETWRERSLNVVPVPHIHRDGTRVLLGGDCHGSAHGILLRRGPHAGRLICPSRTQVGRYHDWDGLRKCSCNNAIYSDDHGLTWQASAPVQLATGEGALLERPDGTLLYNSRAYHRDQKRYLAESRDGGATWDHFRPDGFLLEEENIGCNASLLRVDISDIPDGTVLPDGADGVTLFVNPRSRVRDNMTICISYDSGATWSAVKTVWSGPCAYSSLDYSPFSGRFCLLYEKGRSDPCDTGIAAVEFDMEWLLK